MVVIFSLLIFSLTDISYGVSKDDIQEYIYKVEKKHNIPEHLLTAIVRVESNFESNAHNPSTRKGVAISSFGLGQLTIDTAKWHCNLLKKDLFDYKKNLDCSAKVIKYQLDRYKDKTNQIQYAIAAYNWGTPCVCVRGQYLQELVINKPRRCSYRLKGKLTSACKKKRKFFNQEYVANVLNKYTKRKLAHKNTKRKLVHTNAKIILAHTNTKRKLVHTNTTQDFQYPNLVEKKKETYYSFFFNTDWFLQNFNLILLKLAHTNTTQDFQYPNLVEKKETYNSSFFNTDWFLQNFNLILLKLAHTNTKIKLAHTNTTQDFQYPNLVEKKETYNSSFFNTDWFLQNFNLTLFQ